MRKHIQFCNLHSVNNPNSIHGIYPYRGKISAIDAQQVIKQFKKGKILLDPFCGSGSIEGYKNYATMEKKRLTLERRKKYIRGSSNINQNNCPSQC